MRKLVLVATVLLVMVAGIIGCDQTVTPAPQPDIPRYTADQVIYIASSNSPTCIGKSVPAWAVEYIGNGRWLATKKCVFGPAQVVLSTEKWYFYEDTGKLVKR